MNIDINELRTRYRNGGLLSVAADAKTIKGEKKGYLTGILYLMPDDDLCPNSINAGCRTPCLVTAGRAAYLSSIGRARAEKTALFKHDRDFFLRAMAKSIRTVVRKAEREGMTPVIRPNGTSDEPWEHSGLIEEFPTVQFMDYTKLPRRVSLPNYHLTASYSGRAEYKRTVAKALRLEMNLAAVFHGQLPESFLGRSVINGDTDDLRFLDPERVIVGLKAKGKAKQDTSGFVIATD